MADTDNCSYTAVARPITRYRDINLETCKLWSYFFFFFYFFATRILEASSEISLQSSITSGKKKIPSPKRFSAEIETRDSGLRHGLGV